MAHSLKRGGTGGDSKPDASEGTPPPATARGNRPTPDDRVFSNPTRLQRKTSTMELDDHFSRSQPIKCPPTPLRPPPTPRRADGVTPSVLAARMALDEELSAKKLLFLSPYYPRSSVPKKKHAKVHKRSRSSTSPREHHSDFSDDEELRYGGGNVPDTDSSDDTSDDDLPSDRVPSFDYVARLGEGNFGEVWQVRCCENNRDYAVKKFKRMMQSTQERQRCLREVHMWNKVSDCARIVPLIRAWQDDRHFYIQMKFCEGGTLDRYKHGGRLDEAELWTTLRDAAVALNAIHHIDHVHNDVKPRNMYLAGGHLYLGDFGLMRVSGDDDVEEGDSTYLAPEVLQLRCTTPAADVFALGISFLELAAHVELPPSGPLWQSLRQGDIPGDVLRHMPDMDRTVRWCMQPNPKARPTCAQLLALPSVAHAAKTVPVHVGARTPATLRPASAAFVMSPSEQLAASRSASRTNTPGLSLSLRSTSPFVPVQEHPSTPVTEPRRSLLSEFAKAAEGPAEQALTLAFSSINPSRPTSPRPMSQRTTPSASRSVTPVSEAFASPVLRMQKSMAS